MRYILPAFVAVFVASIAASQAASVHTPNAPPRAAQTPAVVTSAIVGRVVWHGPLPAMHATPVPPTSASACGSSATFNALEVSANEGVAGAVITVEGAPGAAAPAATTITTSGCAFEPHVVAIPAGSRVTFANHDHVLHTVHAFREGISAFNLAMPPGMTLTHTIADPSVIHVQCECGHTWMSAWIHVVNTPYVAVSDASGAFRIANLPPGTYTVRMWHEGWTQRPSNTSRADYGPAVTETASVTVAPGADASHEFALP